MLNGYDLDQTTSKSYPALSIRAWVYTFRHRIKQKWQAMLSYPTLLRVSGLWRLEPIRRDFGWQHGQCIDRYYIENFLAEHAADIHGHILEIGDNTYTTQFGGGRVVRSDILHMKPGHPTATIVADLSRSDGISSGTFDTIILTQTLQFIYDTRGVIRTLHRLLKPGGVLLASFPGISQIARYDMVNWGEYWRFTTLSARNLFTEVFLPQNVEVQAHGNVLAATAFLHGLTSEELRREELDVQDPDYEVLITLRAVKALSN